MHKKFICSEENSSIIIEYSMEQYLSLKYYIVVIKISDIQKEICIF